MKQIFPEWLTRAGAGLAAGLVGAMVLGLIIVLGGSVIGSVLTPPPPEIDELGRIALASEPHALFGVIAVLAVFVSTLVASIISAILRTLGQDSEMRRAVLAQVFLGHMGLFIWLLPAYILSSFLSSGGAGVALAAGVHLLLSLLIGHMAQEHEMSQRHPLLPLYGYCFGVGLFILCIMALFNTSPMVVALAALPIGYMMREIGDAGVSALHKWFSGTWGIEVLSPEVYETTEEDDDVYAGL